MNYKIGTIFLNYLLSLKINYQDNRLKLFPYRINSFKCQQLCKILFLIEEDKSEL